MSRERLHLALDRLRGDQWKLFEEFASAFLSSQYPNLRTVASPSGDDGRDAELFSYDGRIATVLQYSVAKDWRNKIRKTALRISNQLSNTQIVIYVTNQSIFSTADSIKAEILESYGFVLDIHDRDWFLDRFAGDEHREAVSEELATKIVNPYLASKGVLERSAPTLTSTELRGALTFLQLQWEDDTREKGLTRLAFEALVKMVLRNTNKDSRLARSEIHDQVRVMFPNHDQERLVTLVDSALNKLSKRLIRHWIQPDEFCLTYEESVRVQDRLAGLEISNAALDSEIRSILFDYIEESDESDVLIDLARLTINHYLVERGEAFASAITDTRTPAIGVEELRDSAADVVGKAAPGESPEGQTKLRQIIFETVRELLTEPTPIVQNHLRAKADAYTLFAFLGRTPDIQRAVSKMFSHGTIWLDTTIVLPLLAEELIVAEHRRFSQMIKAASDAGLKLCVTPGVIEEVERHINRCITFVNKEAYEWTGNVPFLADAYMRAGRSISGFLSWIEHFEGRERLEDDLAEYFLEFHSIKREGLEAEEEKAAESFRLAAERAWQEAHSARRRAGDAGMDEITFSRLVRHDVENYVGVVERRRAEEVSALGYSAWWLTIDRLARQVDESIKKQLKNDTPASPVMSADFLVNYLTVGPIRAKVRRDVENSLPLALDMDSADELPEDLLSEAERIRGEAVGVSEHIIRRRVRDSLDAAKRRRGRVMAEGIRAVLNRIRSE